MLVDGSEALPIPTGVGYTWGRLGVITFFAISGYLVTESWLRTVEARVFIRNRLLRVYPALAVMVLVSVLAIGASITSAPMSIYFRDRETLTYLAHNLMVFPVAYTLPGVFSENPIPVVNGALWTIGPELSTYALILICALFLRRRLSWGVAILLVASVAIGWLIPTDTEEQYALAVYSQLFAFFLGASLVRLCPEISRPIGVFLGVAFLAVAIGWRVDVATVALLPAMVLLVTSLGKLAPKLHPFARVGDPTYGMYLYGFLISQCLLVRVPNVGHFNLFWISLFSSVAIGFFSWHTVEKRCLRRASRRGDSHLLLKREPLQLER